MSGAAGTERAVPSDATVAVVTGANRWIGRELVRQLATRGWAVVLGARDETKGEHVARQLAGAGGRVLPWQLDVADPISVERLATRVRDDLGRVDVLINNAAIHYDTWQQAVTADLHIVHQAMQTNLSSARGARARR